MIQQQLTLIIIVALLRNVYDLVVHGARYINPRRSNGDGPEWKQLNLSVLAFFLVINVYWEQRPHKTMTFNESNAPLNAQLLLWKTPFKSFYNLVVTCVFGTQRFWVPIIQRHPVLNLKNLYIKEKISWH